jgi:uncharacterized protein involved in exopolysaccharide biosynthesis
MSSPMTTGKLSGADQQPEEDSNEAEIWRLLFSFADNWKLLVWLPFAVGVVAILFTYLVKPSFTSASAFIAESRDRSSSPAGGFAGVASQLGLGLALSPSSSPQFYAELLRTRELLETVLTSRIADSRTPEDDSVVVKETLATRWTRPPLRMDKALQRIREVSSVSLNPRTGMIELRVEGVHPAIAQQIAVRILDVLNRFNLERRRTQAGQRRRFAADRLTDVQDSLRSAEKAQQVFLEGNRAPTQNSPLLMLQTERLQRQVSMYQELYTSLRLEYETARLDEVNDTPVITIIDAPNLPLRKSSPSRAMAGIAGGMMGAFLAVVLVLGRAYMSKLRQDRPVEYREIRARMDALMGPFARRFRPGVTADSRRRE